MEAFANSEDYSTFAAANTGVAQLVEHWSPKPGVGSSSLSSRARIDSYKLTTYGYFLFLGRTNIGHKFSEYQTMLRFKNMKNVEKNVHNKTKKRINQ